MNNQPVVAFFFSIGMLCGLPMFLILMTALLPRHIERAGTTLIQHPRQSFFLGLVNFLFFLTIGVFLAEAAFPLLKFIALVSLFIVLPVIIVTGLAVGVDFIGARVLALFTRQPGRHILRLIVGIVFLGISALTPIVGWAVLLVVIVMGFGAALVSVFRRRPPSPAGDDDDDPLNLRGASEGES